MTFYFSNTYSFLFHTKINISAFLPYTEVQDVVFLRRIWISGSPSSPRASGNTLAPIFQCLLPFSDPFELCEAEDDSILLCPEHLGTRN